MVRSIVASCDRSYEQSWHPACDRSCDRSWHPMTERMINRGTRRSIVASCDQSLRPTTDRRSIVAIVAPNDQTTDRTINCSIMRAIGRSIVASCERSYDQSCDYRSAIIHNGSCHHARLVVRSRKTYLRPLAIWNRRLQVLNMTIDLVATDLPLAITYDLDDQSYVLSTICRRFQFCRSQVGRNLGVSPV